MNYPKIDIDVVLLRVERGLSDRFDREALEFFFKNLVFGGGSDQPVFIFNDVKYQVTGNAKRV